MQRTIHISFLAVLVGVVAGFGAIAFRYLIAFFHNLFFFGTLSFDYNGELPFVSRWGLLVIFVPAVGIALAQWITAKWAPEAKGHGVPEVIAAVMVKRGVIRPVVALIKSFVSAITIGTGGSVGCSGPIVQIGASFGSTLGQVLKLSPRETIILVGAGAAGGIGATFNAPIGGIMFALELILPEYSIMTIMPLVVSSTIATRISTLILGNHPAFVLPEYLLVSSSEILFYIVLGFLAGCVAIAFIHTLYWTEDFFSAIKINATIKALVGGTLIGIIGYLSLRFFGQYYVFGVGYEFLAQVLSSNVPSLLIVLLLVGMKIIAISLTLASGGSGGIFAPSFFLGAASGAALGIMVHSLFPNITGPVSAYAIVGMAAVVSGTTGASLTAIIMIFEMTRNYEIMLPLMLSVVISHFFAAILYKETIYTKKLSRRGIIINLDKRIPLFKSILVGDIMKEDLVFCEPHFTVASVLKKMHDKEIGLLPVLSESRVIGTISFKELYNSKINKDDFIAGLVKQNPIEINRNCTLFEALQKMDRLKTNILLIPGVGGVFSFITRNEIINAYLKKQGSL